MITEYYVHYHKDGESRSHIYSKSFMTEQEREQWIANAKDITILKKFCDSYREQEEPVTIIVGKRYGSEIWEGSTDAGLMGLFRY